MSTTPKTFVSAERHPQRGYTVRHIDPRKGIVNDPLADMTEQELESLANSLGQQAAQSEAYWLQFEATPDTEVNQSYEAYEAWRASVRKGDK